MDSTIRTAIVGIGNCASSLTQLIDGARGGHLASRSGIGHPVIGRFAVSDIQIVAGFDVDARKVGRDLAEAIRAEPNCSGRHVQVDRTGVTIAPGALLDGAVGPLSDWLSIDERCRGITTSDVAGVLRAARADVLINFLPTGSSRAARFYADAALAANVAFINGMPEPIANDPEYQKAFAAANVPLLGDDMRSYLGASTLHMALLELCASRGARIDRTYQLNVGGNADFFNMTDPGRAASKRTSKRAALQRAGLVKHETAAAGPNGYIEGLADEKVAYIEIEGQMLLGSPFSLEVKLHVEDSPNAAATMVDAIRCVGIARDRQLGGVVPAPSAFLFKRPPSSAHGERESLQSFLQFIGAR